MRTPLVLVVLAACASSRAGSPDSPDSVDATPAAPDARPAAMDAGPGPAREACGPSGTRVSTWAPSWRALPQHAVWNGHEYLVVFASSRPSGEVGAPSLYVVRMSADGALVPGSARAISNGGQASLAWSGSEYALAYEVQTISPHTEVHVVRIDASGEPIAGSDHVVSSVDGVLVQPAIAWDPVDRRWGVAWDDETDFYHAHIGLVRLDETGAVVPGGEIPISGAADHADLDLAGTPLVWAGDHFALAACS